MLSEISLVADQPSPSLAAVMRFAELVKKIETSPAPSCYKRKNAARKRMKCIIGEQLRYARSSNLKAVALTLTYKRNEEFSSKHISAFLDRLRRTLKKLGATLPYAWVLECASRLHYHLILWLPRGYMLSPSRLQTWWIYGSTWLESCRNIRAWGHYMCKFHNITKLPKGARMYGYGGLDESGMTALARSALPRWLLSHIQPNCRVYRRRGGGWIDRTTGETFASPYVWTPRGTILRPPQHT